MSNQKPDRVDRTRSVRIARELSQEQIEEIKSRSEWPMRFYGVSYQKQAEEDVRSLLSHIMALEKINARANDRISALNTRLANEE